MAHRVVYLFENGKWPVGHLDHINHIKTDNRIENIRDASPQENARNMSMSKANRSGSTGVFWSNNAKKWTAQIGKNGKAVHLGYFESFNAAKDARAKASKDIGYHANHGAQP